METAFKICLVRRKKIYSWGDGSVCEMSLKYENLSSDLRTYIKSQGVAQHSWKPCIGGCVGPTGRFPKNIGSPLSHINDLQVH